VGIPVVSDRRGAGPGCTFDRPFGPTVVVARPRGRAGAGGGAGRAADPPGPPRPGGRGEGRRGGSSSPPAGEAEAGGGEEKAATKKAEPFAFADFSWVPGNAGASDRPLTLGPFTGEFRVDTAYHHSFSRPEDDTISGSSEVFRHGEFQLTQLGFGGDLLYKNVQARLMTQFGMYSQTTPRNDASPARGQWNLDNAYRYISEAYGGYHIDVLNGINVQAGIFMSYIGLWSYYNFDNWTYQPSYVSSNTPGSSTACGSRSSRPTSSRSSPGW